MTDADPYGSETAWAPGPALPAQPGDGDGAGEGEATLYADLPTWVNEHLALVVRRRLGGSLTWCRVWWRHAEAVSRLNALWQEWERARVEGSLSSWWIYHAGPHLDALMSRDSGPFMACRPAEQDGHHELEPLPCDQPDPSLWLGSAFSDPDSRAPAPEPHSSAGAPPPGPGPGSDPGDGWPPPAATASR